MKEIVDTRLRAGDTRAETSSTSRRNKHLHRRLEDKSSKSVTRKTKIKGWWGEEIGRFSNQPFDFEKD